MRAYLTISCLSAALALSGCATMNKAVGSLGFGGTRVVEAKSRANLPNLVPEGGRGALTDGRPLAAAVVSSELTPTTTGALLRVDVVPAGDSAYNGDLVLSAAGAGVMTFDARLQITGAAAAPSPARVSLARNLTHTELTGLREIRIRAANGVTVVRR